MGEMAQILALWRRAQAHGETVCLATVVHVQGSSYRKPGARMLITSGGERAGTISGGCLEAEVSRKAWWLTRGGPVVQQYQSSFDEDGSGVPWGLGCGGTVWVLLEQNPVPVLRAMEAAREAGRPSVIVSRIAAPAGAVSVFREQAPAGESLPAPVIEAARRSFAERRSFFLEADLKPELEADLAVNQRSGRFNAGGPWATGTLPAEEAPSDHEAQDTPAWFVEYLAPPPRLTIFGAGDDAQPIARFADALGWRVAVADGRVHLLRRERFPQAAELRLLQYGGPRAESSAALQRGASSVSPVACGLNEAAPPAQQEGAPGEPTSTLSSAFLPSPASSRASSPAFSRAPSPASAAVSSQVSAPVSLDDAPSGESFPLPDTGVEPGELAVVLTHSFDQDRALLAALLPQPLAYLGLLGPRHRTLRLLEEVAPTLGWSTERCLARLHSPVGLDLGARDPASIALSIVAELQATVAGRHVAVSREPAMAAEQQPDRV